MCIFVFSNEKTNISLHALYFHTHSSYIIAVRKPRFSLTISGVCIVVCVRTYSSQQEVCIYLYIYIGIDRYIYIYIYTYMYLSSPKPGHTAGGSGRGARQGGGAGSGRTGCLGRTLQGIEDTSPERLSRSTKQGNPM